MAAVLMPASYAPAGDAPSRRPASGSAALDGVAAGAVVMPSGEAIRRLAHWALAFDTKLSHLVHDLDTDWQAPLLSPWAFMEAMSAERSGALWPRLWRSRLGQEGAWPRLDQFEDPWWRLCLLPRAELLHRLCVLALARRPGVLRCCIDRSVRVPLQRALADAFPILSGFSLQGRPVDAVQAGWSPVEWACVGFLDWADMLGEDARLIQTLVRWSLPRQMLDLRREAGPVPAERSAESARRALVQAGLEWPC